MRRRRQPHGGVWAEWSECPRDRRPFADTISDRREPQECGGRWWSWACVSCSKQQLRSSSQVGSDAPTRSAHASSGLPDSWEMRLELCLKGRGVVATLRLADGSSLKLDWSPGPRATLNPGQQRGALRRGAQIQPRLPNSRVSKGDNTPGERGISDRQWSGVPRVPRE